MGVGVRLAFVRRPAGLVACCLAAVVVSSRAACCRGGGAVVVAGRVSGGVQITRCCGLLGRVGWPSGWPCMGRGFLAGCYQGGRLGVVAVVLA